MRLSFDSSVYRIYGRTYQLVSGGSVKFNFQMTMLLNLVMSK